MKPSKKILIIGAGYLGQRVAHFASIGGWSVVAARRVPPEQGATQNPVTWISMDVTNEDSIKAGIEEATGTGALTAVVYCVSAGEQSEYAYQRAYEIGVRNVIRQLPSEALFVFVSSTGVYHQDLGEFVDETTPTSSTSLSGHQSYLLSGESLVQSRPKSIIARLSGIYGPGRTRLISMAKAMTNPYIVEQRAYTNRIHVDDGARAILHLLDCKTVEKVYCITDHEPSMLVDVLTWIRGAIAIPPADVRYKNGETFVADVLKLPATNKCISNRLLLGTGFKFQFPTFREGYSQLL